MRAVLALIALLAIPLALAQAEFVADIEPSQVSIGPNQTAVFNISIAHTQDTELTFSAFSPDVLWDVRTDRPLVVPPDKRLEAKLYIRPLLQGPGIYGVPIHIGLQGLFAKKVLLIELLGYPPTKEYLPAVRGSVELPAQLDPRQQAVLLLRLQNMNPKNLTLVVVKIRSKLINLDKQLSLGPLENTSIELPIALDPLTPPQTDLLRTTVIVEDERAYSFELSPVQYEIIAYGEIEREISRQGILTRRAVYRFVNTANVPLSQRFELPTWFLLDLLTKSSPKPIRAIGKWIWEISLGPGESTEIVTATFYHPFILLGLLIAAAIAAALLLRSPLVITKQVELIGTEVGLSEFKIKIALRNRSRSKLREIKLLDTVPGIVELVQPAELGTVQPAKIVRSAKHGIIVHWELELEPKEERLIAYTAKSKLGLVGKLVFPATLARFKLPSGAERYARGNVPEIRV